MVEANNLRFQDEYDLQMKINKGSYGKVFRARHRQTGQEFTVKKMSKAHLAN